MTLVSVLLVSLLGGSLNLVKVRRNLSLTQYTKTCSSSVFNQHSALFPLLFLYFQLTLGLIPVEFAGLGHLVIQVQVEIQRIYCVEVLKVLPEFARIPSPAIKTGRRLSGDRKQRKSNNLINSDSHLITCSEAVRSTFCNFRSSPFRPRVDSPGTLTSWES